MKPIYLDYNATTPVDPRVLEKMLPYFGIQFGNPASASHQWGWAAETAVKKARAQAAHLIHAKESEITFTAGSTESNNMTVFGLIRRLRLENPRAPLHMITTRIEHESVRQAFLFAQKFHQVEVDFLPVDQEGFLDVETLRATLKPHTVLVSVIWVQNEIGTIQNMQKIAALTREKKIYLHTDATQAVGKIPVDVEQVPVDFLSASAHKFYGPKGAGILYMRSQNPKVQIEGLILGGGQEKNLRSGTLNVPAIVGLGEAAEICAQSLPAEQKHCEELRDLLWQKLSENIPGLRLNGPRNSRSPINLSVMFGGYRLQDMLAHLPPLALSSGSACHSGTWSYSPTLKALGLSDEEAQSTLRLSLGRGTTREEILEAAQILQKACEKSRI